MTEPTQGSVFWASLPEPAGRRPVLILTRTSAIPRLTNITVAPLTRSQRHIAAEVDLDVSDGLPSVCAVSLDNILTIPQSSLDRPIAQLSEERMDDVFEAIRCAFEMHD